MNNGPEKELNGLGDTGADRAAADGTVVGGPFGDLRSVLNGGSASGLGGDLDGSLDAGPDGALDADELALRRLLHGAVGGLKPSEGALDHLRRAVPTRRARKRQAVVGAAAAALLFGTAVPAFVHVANSTSTSEDNSVAAGHGERSHSDASTDTRPDDGRKDGEDTPSDKVSEGGSSSVDTTEKPSETPSDAAASGGKGDPGTAYESGGDAKSSAAAASACDASRLAVASQEVGAPDATGTVYGTFRIANTSDAGCVVSGGGSFGRSTSGAADATKVVVVPHAAGDAAAGLPDPSLWAASLTLAPSASYEVKFAWVPSETCPTVGTPPSPTPSDDATTGTSMGTGATTGGEDGGGSGTETQLMTDEGVQDGSVTVTYTTDAGAPTAVATIPNACAGTVYRTGLLDTSAP
ncbi:hypothetical protein [Streptomyces sp. NPDC088554]|uniref:hypothetical protein n=1 Tax=Streptomyces sp. NPDC088554 TaxID=3365865 RepID=UPI0038235316